MRIPTGMTLFGMPIVLDDSLPLDAIVLEDSLPLIDADTVEFSISPYDGQRIIIGDE